VTLEHSGLNPGARVRVSARPHEGHHRTPGYLKGKVGVVERAHATFTDPETRAYGGDGLPERRVYLVSFQQRELWPSYGAADRLYADVFEHWLEPA
jgi:nitrile hydratase subunit beta